MQSSTEFALGGHKCAFTMIEDSKRGGKGQVAESSAEFSRQIFVVHPNDVDLVRLIDSLATSKPFVVVIVGIPGTGKTELLQTLCCTDLPKFVGDSGFESTLKRLRGKLDFIKVENLKDETRGKRDKPVVWVEPTLDLYFAPGAGLGEFESCLTSCIEKGDSLIVAGNIGILSQARGEVDFLQRLEDAAKSQGAEFHRVPDTQDGFWIKEYGKDPLSENDKDLFREFSSAFLRFLFEFASSCHGNKGDRCTDKKTCQEFLSTLRELAEMIREDAFCRKVYDLLCAVRLVHRDVYLTPRTLITYWAYVADNILQRIKIKRFDNRKELIYASVNSSRLPSNYLPQSYELSEAGVDVCRTAEIDKILREKYDKYLDDRDLRRDARLSIYFENKMPHTEEMIYDSIYADFIDSVRSKTIIINAFERFFVYRDVTFQRPLEELRRIVEQDKWADYLFSLPYFPSKRQTNYITNEAAITEEFLQSIYEPLIIQPIDFSRNKARTIKLNLMKKALMSPSINIDMEIFSYLVSLEKGFYVDLSIFPQFLIKIERFMSEIQDAFEPVLTDFLYKVSKSNDVARGKATHRIEEGVLK